MLLAAWLLGEKEKGEWLVSSILASFSGFHSPRPKAVAGQAPDEVEVTAWRTAADRCPLDNPSSFLHVCDANPVLSGALLCGCGLVSSTFPKETPIAVERTCVCGQCCLVVIAIGAASALSDAGLRA